MAIEFMWRFFAPSSPDLWNQLYAGVVGHEQAAGAGSVHRTQHAAYEASRFAMLFHTVTGGTAILLATAQFSRRLRAGRPRLHRVLGRVHVTLVVIAMVGAAAYLLQTGPDETFAGPGFYLQLWLLTLGTLASTVLAVAAIRSGDVSRHQSLMAYSFALLLTAPLLRVFWLAIGVAWPAGDQDQINLISAVLVPEVAIGGAIVASRHVAPRRPAGLVDGRFAAPDRLARALLVTAGVATSLVAVRHLSVIGMPDAVLVAAMVGVAAWLGLAFAMLRRTAARGDLRAAHEWRAHTLAALAIPLVVAVVWPAYDLAFGTLAAFHGALLTAPAVAMTAGLVFVLHGRRTPRRAASSRAPGTPAVARPLAAGGVSTSK